MKREKQDAYKIKRSPRTFEFRGLFLFKKKSKINNLFQPSEEKFIE